MNRPNNQKQQPEEKKSPVGKIIAAVIVLIILAAVVMIGIKIPETMELERQMDAAALSITNDAVTMLAGAIEQNPRAANKADAIKLVNEMIGVMVSEAVSATDYRTLEGIEKELNSNTAWKPYATEENQKLLADAWADVIRRMQEEHDKLVDLKEVAVRIQNAVIPSAADVVEFYDFKLPVGFAEYRPVQMATAFAAAVAIKNQDLANQILAEAADQESLRAGTEEPCRECNSQGSVPCSSCTANPGKCPTCKGTGSMKVSRFVDNKVQATEQPCTRCKGTGECVVCKGTGKRPCFYCKGTARRTNTEIAAGTMRKGLNALIERIDVQASELERLKPKALQ